MNEKKEIEEYMKLYCLEQCLDEIMNIIVVDKPTNPYMEISKLFQSKTLPEIIDISFQPIIISGTTGVRAVLLTNVSKFSGICSYNTKNKKNINLNFKDYNTLREKVKEAIKECNPTELFKIDECISKVSDIDQAESLALSIACCRASSYHKGLKLHQYVSQLVGIKEDYLRIPIPVSSILSRAIDSDIYSQDIMVAPIKATSFVNAIEMINKAQTAVSNHDVVKQPFNISFSGSPAIERNNFNAALKIVLDTFNENSLSKEFKLSVNFRGDQLLKMPFDVNNPVFLYRMEASASIPPKNSSDAVDMYLNLWQDYDIFSMEEMVDPRDKVAIGLFQKRCREITYELKGTEKVLTKYCFNGIGGDGACTLQFPLDAINFMKIENFEQFSEDTPYNCIKIQLSSFSNISSIIEVVKKAHRYKWPIILSSNDIPECLETVETFHADFAIGIGAKQFMCGSLHSYPFVVKYNRILEIIEENPRIPYVGNNFRI